MQIDQITINLRPRSTWEAVDLGFGLARIWWPTLMFSWIVLALPVFVIASLVFYDNPVIASVVFWWFKPMYEQLPLHFISRAIFKDEPSKKQMLKQLYRVAARQLIANLTWRRFSFNRSYTAPVAQLEGLSGSRRRERIRVLSETRNVGAKLTIVCMHMEAALYISLLALAWIFVPAELDFVDWINENQNAATILVNVMYFIGVTIIAPFYVVSGFCLYLNRRTHLEGWDIELAFKRIKERLSKTKAVAFTASIILSIFALTSTLMYSPTSYADNNSLDRTELIKSQSSTTQTNISIDGPGVANKKSKLVSSEEARQLIDKILDHEDFGEKKTVKVWRLKDEFRDEEEEKKDVDLSFMGKFVQLMSDIGYFLMWAGLAFLVIFILYQFPKWKSMIDFGARKAKPKLDPVPEVLFGLEITEESLPDDISAEAWQLFKAQKPRQALGLLYRGSLSVLVNKYGLIVKDSDTEGECADKVKQHHAQVNEFFSLLTSVWVFMAYGHQLPSEQQMQTLCGEWKKYFGEQTRD